ncbi:hypothetical protein FBR05_07770 [Deltaproteobacteria bacterium PRO3]|nr:hypothetical protein [Deltaproteobacteria bacterium PRO3]
MVPPMVSLNSRSSEKWALATVLSAAFALFTPMMLHTMVGETDFPFHLEFARKMWSLGEPATPHFLYQALVIAVALALHGFDASRAALPGGFENAGFVIGVCAYLLLAFILYRTFLTHLRPGEGWKNAWVAACLALALMLVAPVNLLSIPSRKLYLGYIGMNIFHSSTMRLVVPLSVWLFFEVLRSLRGEDGASGAWRRTAVLALATALNVLAKPNFAICLLPALGLAMAWRLGAKKRIDALPLLLGVFGMAVAILLWQYQFAFERQALGTPMKIVWAPFQVHGLYSSWLLPKFLLSIAFPLYVSLAYARCAREDFRLSFAWLIFAFGAFYEYFLAQAEPSSPNFGFGDFFWSGQISLYLLFIASVLFLINLPPSERGRRWWPGWGVFGLHLCSGLVWYYVQLTSRPVSLWW